jgi:hypothetical protein
MPELMGSESIGQRAAGTGGEMVVMGVGTVGAKKAGGKPRQRRGTEKAPSAKNKRAEKPSSAAEVPEKKMRGNGLERLEKAADRRLGQASEKLADLLLKKATKGKVDSARLLVTLAEHRIKRKPQERKKKKKRSGPSWAELLASEPEFVQPEVGDVWVGDGWRKPTGKYVNEYAKVGDSEEEEDWKEEEAEGLRA